jgi:hypothetical protein
MAMLESVTRAGENVASVGGGAQALAGAARDMASGIGSGGSGIIATTARKTGNLAGWLADVATRPLRWGSELVQKRPMAAKAVVLLGGAYAAKKAYDYVTHHDVAPEMTAPVAQLDQMNAVNGQVLNTMVAAQHIQNPDVPSNLMAANDAEYQGKGVAGQHMALAGGYNR